MELRLVTHEIKRCNQMNNLCARCTSPSHKFRWHKSFTCIVVHGTILQVNDIIILLAGVEK